MTTFIKNSKEEFISEIEEMFDREVSELGYGIRDAVLVKKCDEMGVEYQGLGDKALFGAFGTIEAFSEACCEEYTKRENALIKKIDYAICMMAAAGRINGSIKLYPNYNPDDTSIIAQEIVNGLVEFHSEDNGI